MLLTGCPELWYKFRVAVAKGYSSVGRTLVSKTKCRGFESFCPCCEEAIIERLWLFFVYALWAF